MALSTSSQSAQADRSLTLPSSATGLLVGIAGTVVSVLVLHWPTTVSMVEIWLRSTTYQHGVLVIPAFAWMVWLKRVDLMQFAPRPWLPGVLLIAACGLVWQAGELLGANVVSHAAVVGSAIGAVLTIFGVAIAQRIAFPLAFLIFAVPFGDVFVPSLVNWTADAVVLALRASGVPVYREGPNFVVPSGSWSVVEACSGIKYLVASTVIGTLYSWLMFRSTRKRLIMIAASIVMPVLLNWLRAYLIVMIAHHTDNRWMTGLEHITFGWILFGVAMLGLFALAARWRDDELTMAAFQPVPKAGPAASRPKVMVVAALVLVVVLAWPFANGMLVVGDQSTPRLVRELLVPGWHAADDPVSTWKPSLPGAGPVLRIGLTNGNDRIGVIVALFDNGAKSREFASSANEILPSDGLAWRLVSDQVVRPEGALSPVREVVARSGRDRMRIWQVYWIGGRYMVSQSAAKIALAEARLTRRHVAGAWIALYATEPEGGAASAPLAHLTRSLQVPLNEWLWESVR